jgi:DUF971 family protein
MTPHEVRLTPGHLILAWDEGSTALPAQQLRARCRCADCLSGQVTAVGDGVMLSHAEAVGAYGLQLIFSDGHERGIYPWPFLYKLAQEAGQG